MNWAHFFPKNDKIQHIPSIECDCCPRVLFKDKIIEHINLQKLQENDVLLQL